MSGNSSHYPYGLFEVFGLELEYMIVARKDLSVLACADKILVDDSGELQDELEFPEDGLAWSNELAAHVLEFKAMKPVPQIEGMEAKFLQQVKHANERLEKFGAVLMPGAAHPWMMPDREFVIWPHGTREIYNKYDEIFGCKGHGWSNLQSAHINLPFRDDEQFARLHAALRTVIPVTSGLTASSPYLEGKFTGTMDARMDVYRSNAKRIPEMAGLVVPEPAVSREDYNNVILNPLYDALRPYDAEGLLAYEWANSRGCIARFDRGAIELRTLSTQECPLADMAVASLVVAVVRALAESRWVDFAALNRQSTEDLHVILLDTINEADNAKIIDRNFLKCFGADQPCSSLELWNHCFEELKSDIPDRYHAVLRHIFGKGTLARRMFRNAGEVPSHGQLYGIAEQLVQCLSENRLFQ